MKILLKGYKKYSIMCIMATVLQVICYLKIPMLVAKILNEVMKQQNEIVIIKTGSSIIVYSLLAMLFGVICTITGTNASQGVGSNARKLLFDKILTLSNENMDNFSRSSLITRVSNDTIILQKGYYTVSYQLLYAMLLVLFSLVYLWKINWKLSLLVTGIVVLFLICIRIILNVGLPKFSKLQKESENLNLLIKENTVAQRVVKTLGSQNIEQNKLNKLNVKLTKILTSAFGSFMLLFPISNLLMFVSILLILWFGGKITSVGGINLGDFSSVLSYTFQIFGALITFSVSLPEIGKAIVSLKRLLQVMETTPSMADTGDIQTLKNGDLQFENVTFKYSEETSVSTLSNVSFTLLKNQFWGVIGSTGEGKSSLVKLLLRLYEPSEGKIYINNNDIKDYSLHSYRNGMSVALQDNMLFSGTIMDNIKWGNPNATDDQVQQVCIDAQAHDFILSMPDQYDTWIKQGSTNISGGQRQRLCIARALLSEASIYIFDDCMSALDTITERKIQEVIKKKYDKSTIIMVAQKISSVKDATNIVVLDGGEIVGSGTHEDLLTKNKIYQQIYASQY